MSSLRIPSPTFSPSTITSLSPSSEYDQYLYGESPGAVDDISHPWMRFCVLSIGLFWAYVFISFLMNQADPIACFVQQERHRFTIQASTRPAQAERQAAFDPAACFDQLQRRDFAMPASVHPEPFTRVASVAEERRHRVATSGDIPPARTAAGRHHDTDPPAITPSVRGIDRTTTETAANFTQDASTAAEQQSVVFTVAATLPAEIVPAPDTNRTTTESTALPTDIEQQHIVTLPSAIPSVAVSSSQDVAADAPASPTPIDLAANVPPTEFPSVPSEDTATAAEPQVFAVPPSEDMGSTNDAATVSGTGGADNIELSIAEILRERELQRRQYKNKVNKLHLKHFVHAMGVNMRVKQDSLRPESSIIASETKNDRDKGGAIDDAKDLGKASAAFHAAGGEPSSIKQTDGDTVLVLPVVRQEPNNDGDDQMRAPAKVANGCAICLESYKIGDSVSWSTNHKCKHAFHTECIVEYFARLMERKGNENGRHLPCPSCRSEFLNLPSDGS